MKIVIPEKIKIGGLVFDVKFDSKCTRDKHALGQSCGNDTWISIDNTLPQQIQESTLLHEIIEQIDFVYDIGLEHHKISLIEAALFQVIKDNPNMFVTEERVDENKP